MRRMKLCSLRLLGLTISVMLCYGCAKNEDINETSTSAQEESETEDVDETGDAQESEGETYGTDWLSSGKWDEYLEIICDYADGLGLATEYVEESGYYDLNKGIICDLDCDGMAPELLVLDTTESGYTVNIYYIANDGSCTVTAATGVLLNREYAPSSLYLSKSETCFLWDIVVEENLDVYQRTAFFKYENSYCACSGSVMGSLKSQGTDDNGNEIYEYYGVYVLDAGNTWNGYALTQRYTVSEAGSDYDLYQVLPDYLQNQYPDIGAQISTSSNGVAYYDISGADYMTIAEDTYYTPMDFSHKLQFSSTEVLPIGYIFGDEMILVETAAGEMGYLEVEKLIATEQ